MNAGVDDAHLADQDTGGFYISHVARIRTNVWDHSCCVAFITCALNFAHDDALQSDVRKATRAVAMTVS